MALLYKQHQSSDLLAYKTNYIVVVTFNRIIYNLYIKTSSSCIVYTIQRNTVRVLYIDINAGRPLALSVSCPGPHTQPTALTNDEVYCGLAGYTQAKTMEKQLTKWVVR